MFCVMTQSSFPSLSSSATARWARLGSALAMRPLSMRSLHCLRRVPGLSRKRKMVNSSGSKRSQMPPGLRKSGMPDSVLTPAPVKTTIRLDPAISAASFSILPFSPSSVTGHVRAQESPGRHGRASPSHA